jgi:hypothetical protein
VEGEGEGEGERSQEIRKSKRRSVNMDFWPEDERRKVVAYCVREVCKWCLHVAPLPTSGDLTSKVFVVWGQAVAKFPASGFGKIPGKIEAAYIKKQHTNARSGLVCKIKDKILDMYKLRDHRHNPASMSRWVTQLLRDDQFIFDPADRDDRIAPYAGFQIAAGLYEHFFSSKSGESTATYRIEKLADITKVTVCLTASIMEWQLRTYKAGSYTSPGHFSLDSARDLFNKHIQCFNLNYPEDDHQALALESIRLAVRNIRASRGRVVPPTDPKAPQVYGDRAEINQKLRERVRKARFIFAQQQRDDEEGLGGSDAASESDTNESS